MSDAISAKREKTPAPEHPALVYAINRATDTLVGSPALARAAIASVRQDWDDPQSRQNMQDAYEDAIALEASAKNS